MATNDRNYVREVGRNRGREWAKSSAKSKQLKNLERFCKQWEREPGGLDRFFGEPPDAYSKADHIYFVIAPENQGDRRQAMAFWDSVFFGLDLAPDLSEDNDALHGFIDGALDTATVPA